jgi:hypothetical protein
MNLLQQPDGSIRSFDEFFDLTTGNGRVDEESLVPSLSSSHTFYNKDSLQLLKIASKLNNTKRIFLLHSSILSLNYYASVRQYSSSQTCSSIIFFDLMVHYDSHFHTSLSQVSLFRCSLSSHDAIPSKYEKHLTESISARKEFENIYIPGKERETCEYRIVE